MTTLFLAQLRHVNALAERRIDTSESDYHMQFSDDDTDDFDMAIVVLHALSPSVDFENETELLRECMTNELFRGAVDLLGACDAVRAAIDALAE